jgi:hypothetical protein
MRSLADTRVASLLAFITEPRIPGKGRETI